MLYVPSRPVILSSVRFGKAASDPMSNPLKFRMEANEFLMVWSKNSTPQHRKPFFEERSRKYLGLLEGKWLNRR